MTNTIEQLENTALEVENEIEKIHSDIEPLKKKKLNQKCDELQVILDEIAELKLATQSVDNPDWGYLLEARSEFHSRKDYDFFMKCVMNYDMWGGGHWNHNDQPAIHIKLTYGSEESLQKNLEGIKATVSYYQADDDGYVYYDLFEHTLSKYESYYVRYNPQTDDVKLMTTRYHRSTEKSIGGLEEAMKWLQENHWYDGKETDDD